MEKQIWNLAAGIFIKGKSSANETRARALEFCKFLDIFGRLKGEELGTCFSTVGPPGALFIFTSN